jgi:hypothetical protein
MLSVRVVGGRCANQHRVLVAPTYINQDPNQSIWSHQVHHSKMGRNEGDCVGSNLEPGKGGLLLFRTFTTSFPRAKSISEGNVKVVYDIITAMLLGTFEARCPRLSQKPLPPSTTSHHQRPFAQIRHTQPACTHRDLESLPCLALPS